MLLVLARQQSHPRKRRACLIRSETILKTNGFPNRYWGWGGEDDEMWWRFQRCNLTLERYPLESGRYTSLRHKKAHGGVEMMRSSSSSQSPSCMIHKQLTLLLLHSQKPQIRSS